MLDLPNVVVAALRLQAERRLRAVLRLGLDGVERGASPWDDSGDDANSEAGSQGDAQGALAVAGDADRSRMLALFDDGKNTDEDGDGDTDDGGRGANGARRKSFESPARYLPDGFQELSIAPSFVPYPIP